MRLWGCWGVLGVLSCAVPVLIMLVPCNLVGRPTSGQLKSQVSFWAALRRHEEGPALSGTARYLLARCPAAPGQPGSFRYPRAGDTD